MSIFFEKLSFRSDGLECRENRSLEVFVDELFNRGRLINSEDLFVGFVVFIALADDEYVAYGESFDSTRRESFCGFRPAGIA